MTRKRSLKDRLGVERENIAGQYIRHYRLLKFPDMSMEEFCDHVKEQTGLKLTKSMLNKLETGEQMLPDWYVFLFAKLLRVSIGQLYGFD